MVFASVRLYALDAKMTSILRQHSRRLTASASGCVGKFLWSQSSASLKPVRPWFFSGSMYRSFATAFSLDGQTTCPMYGVVDRATSTDVAITDTYHGTVTYRRIYNDAANIAAALAERTQGVSSDSESPPCVAVLSSNSYGYTAAQWACWSLGHVFVPLSSLHPQKMLEYFLQDSAACGVVYDSAHAEMGLALAEQFKLPTLNLDQHLTSASQESS